MPLQIQNEWQGNVKVYYQLTNFFQNLDKYSHSRNDRQLSGSNLTVGELDSCKPVVTNAQLGKEFSVNNTPLDPQAAAIPCGVVAQSFFNDTFAMYTKYPDLTRPELNKI